MDLIQYFKEPKMLKPTLFISFKVYWFAFCFSSLKQYSAEFIVPLIINPNVTNNMTHTRPGWAVTDPLWLTYILTFVTNKIIKTIKSNTIPT